jgi:hypothetical protein
MTLLLLPASLKLTFLRSSRKIKAFAAPALGAHGAPAGPMLWPSSVSNDAPSEIERDTEITIANRGLITGIYRLST